GRYWNCGHEVVARLVEAITAAFEHGDLAYTLKCPTEPALFERQDAFVIYLSATVWERTAQRVRHVHERLASHLRPSVPPLTLRLGPGLAAAEDPADRRSFRHSPSPAVADGALRTVGARVPSESARVSILASSLAAHGIAADRPYLRAGSRFDWVRCW